MKKILVTGATGFIGNYVIKELLENNCRVIATSKDPAKAAAASWFTQVTYIPFDLAESDDAADHYSFFQSPDAMIHLAWEGLPNYSAAFHIAENLPRHLTFIENMMSHGLADLTVTGTCFEYGMQEGRLSEDMEARPANAYAIAKDTLRKELEAFRQQHDLSFKWIRLFYMYGAGQNPNSLLSQLDRALANNEPSFNMSGGEQVRDFLPVEKVAEYIVAIALQQKITGIINCCSGQPVSVKKFVEDHLAKRGKKIQLNTGYYPYVDYEPMSFWGDDSKLRSIIK